MGLSSLLFFVSLVLKFQVSSLYKISQKIPCGYGRILTELEEKKMIKLTEKNNEINERLKQLWNEMSYYERFEHIVASVLRLVITVIIIVALWRLIIEVYRLLILGIFDPLDYRVFQLVFGMIMTLLIAMEFKHSILKFLDRNSHIIQVKTVVLIAQLALARKFIILDITTIEASKVAALGFAVLVLGLVYWLFQELDNRSSNTCRN